MTSTVSVVRDGQIAVLTIDNPPVNVFSRAVRAELRDAVATIASDPAIRGVVLLCAGKTFVSGADLRELDAGIEEPGYHPVFEAIESLQKPVVAALHGATLGAGIELALACHYRIAAPNAKLGMPEITLGIVPGAGGTQRLPRLVGAKRALDMLLSGRPVTAQEAAEMGLVDKVASGDLRAAAISFAGHVATSNTPPRRTRELTVRDAENGTFSDAEALAAKTLRGRTTPALVIEAVRAAATLPFRDGLRKETELSARSLEQAESKALRHLFFAERQTSRIPGMREDTPTRPLERVGIVGAGTMGGGIAMCFADIGLPVHLVDVTQEALERGLSRIEGNYRASVRRGRLSEEDVARRMALIRGTTDYDELRGVDLVIEAVVENMSLKQEVFRKLDTVARRGAILATNTSTLDINAIAAVTGRPEDVIGLHFFSPANVMRLLEIVRADRTGDDVVATAFAIARRIRKIGVLSRVCYGFIGNRMMDPYAREAERAVLEGATPAQVDGALEQSGMAMGILAVFDLAGVDVGVLTRKERGALLPPDPTYYRCSALLYERGWFGQKSGRGFYVYEGRERKPNPQAEAMFREEARRLGVEQRAPDAEEIQRRCFYALVNEGAKILEEGVALRPSDIDVVYTAGYGFPRHRGGPMYWADSVGLGTILKGIEAFANRFGEMHWKPAPLLAELARVGKGFKDWRP